MTRSLPYLTFALLLTGGLSLFAAGAPVCEIRDIESAAVRGRASQMTFPNGINIQIVGHNHGERNPQRDLLINLANPAVSDQAAADMATPILTQSQKSLDFFKSDVEYIRQYIATHPGEANLWSESSEEAVNERAGATFQASNLRPNNSNLFNDAILYSSGSPAIYALAKLNLPARIQVHGVETITTEINSLRLRAEELERRGQEAGKLAPPGEQMPEALKSALKLMIASWNDALARGDSNFLMSYNPELIYSLVRNANISPQTKTALNFSLSGKLLDYQSYSLRNEQNVTTLISSQRSGVLFIGASHVVPMMNILKKRCQEVLAGALPAGRPPVPVVPQVSTSN